MTLTINQQPQEITQILYKKTNNNQPCVTNLNNAKFHYSSCHEMQNILIKLLAKFKNIIQIITKHSVKQNQ